MADFLGISALDGPTSNAISKIANWFVNLIFTHINKHLRDSVVAFREPDIHHLLSVIKRGQ